jgi:hypothetical protein
MSDLGAHVRATDFSEGTLERGLAPRRRGRGRTADATVEDQLLALGESGSLVLEPFFDHGFVLDALDEPLIDERS